MNAKLSLVFPCYHAAQYMDRVLEELQAQTFKDFEAILVNDGDDSQVEAMERIAAQDNRIKIVHRKENGGVAAARNSGTDAVSSHWVTYPDPDDRFGSNYVRSLFEAVDGKDVEMACSGFSWFSVRSGKIKERFIGIDSSPLFLEMSKGYEIMWKYGVCGTAWNKLYSMKVIHENKLHQDTSFMNWQDAHFNQIYFPFVRRVGLVKDCGYVYHSYDSGTNTLRYNPNYLKNRIFIIGLREQFHRRLGWPEQRIIDAKRRELASEAIIMFKNLLAFDNHLTVNEASQKIKSELLSQPEIVDAVLQADFGKDYLQRLTQLLVRIGNARFAAITFKTLANGKRRFSNLYERMKPFVRGE